MNETIQNGLACSGPNKGRMPLSIRRLSKLLAASVVVSSLAGSASAANKFWVGPTGTTNAPTSGIWQTTTPTVWSDGTIETANKGWTANDSAFFGGADGSYGIQVPAALTATSLRFTASGYALTNATAQTITVAAATTLVIVDSGKTATIGTNVTVAGSANGAYLVGALAGSPGGTLIVDNGASLTSGKSLTINGTGTVLTVKGKVSTANQTSAYLALGTVATDDVTLKIDGGTVQILKNSGSIWIPGSPSLLTGPMRGTLTMTNAAVFTEVGGFVALGSGTNNLGILNLDGGTLTTASIQSGGTGGTPGYGTSILNLNGGTLKAQQASGNFINKITAAYVRDGGAIINNNAFALTIGQPLLHSTNAADKAIDGGLTIFGTSAVTLTNANTYTGPTLVSASTLALTNLGAINNTSSLILSNSSLLVSITPTFPTNIVAGTFSTLGTANTINIPSFVGAGTFPLAVTLIKYSTLAPGVVDVNNAFTALNLVLPTAGALTGYLTNNTVKNTIDLVLTGGTLGPTIASEPGFVLSRYAGLTTKLKVVANNALGYQWKKNGVNLADNANVSGTTSNILTIASLSSAETGVYTLLATNLAGSVITDPCQLSIVTPDCAYETSIVSNSPVAYYRLSETGDPSSSTVLAYDYAGGFDGTYGPEVITGDQGPIQSSFPGFDSGNTCAYVQSYTPSLSKIAVPSWDLNTNTVTMITWIKPQGAQDANTGLIFNRGTVIAGLGFSGVTDANGNRTLGYTWNNDASTYGWNSGLVPPDGQWSLVALVVTSTNAVIYMGNANGIASSTHTYAHPNQAFTGPITLGNDEFGTVRRMFNGHLDEVAIFAKSFSSDQITALVTNATGITTFAPVITTEPASKTFYPYQTVQLTVGASGTQPLSYQWKIGTNGVYVNLVDAGRVSGSQTGILTITGAMPSDAADYIVVVSNSQTAVTSTPATLSDGTYDWDAGNTANGRLIDPANGSWDTSSGSAVWNTSAGNVAWANGNAVRFGGADGNYNVKVGAGLSMISMLFTNSGYTLTADSPQAITATGTPYIMVDSGKTATIGTNVTITHAVTAFFGASGNNLGGTLNIENGAVLQETGARTWVLDGAGVVVSVKTGGVLKHTSGTSGQFAIGASNTGNPSTLSVDGGDVQILGTACSFNVGTGNAYQAGVLTLNSGTVSMPAGTTVPLSLGIAATNSGTLNLNGGTLSVAQITTGGGYATSIVNFNGGTLKAVNGTFASRFVAGVNIANVRNGGAILDNNGLNLTLNKALTHSTNTTDSAIDGGLTSAGSGSLTLTNVNTFTGPTLVMNGTLALVNSGSINSSTSLCVSNATLAFAADATQPAKIVTGTVNTLGTNNTINITAFQGAGNAPLHVPVINYTSLAAGVVDANNELTSLSLVLPGNYTGYLANNAATKSIELVLTSGDGIVTSLPPGSMQLGYSNGALQLSWTNANTLLLESTNILGPWMTNGTASSPFQVNPTVAQKFFRLQSQ